MKEFAALRSDGGGADRVHSNAGRRDLQRGRALELPSGETVSRAMGVEPLSTEECNLGDPALLGETPLWLYILKEAEIRERMNATQNLQAELHYDRRI